MEENSMRTQLGQRIRSLRKQQGLTIAELAHNAECEYSFYCKIEKGTVNTSIDKLTAISSALGVGITELFAFEDSTAREELIEGIVKGLERMGYSELKTLHKLITKID